MSSIVAVPNTKIYDWLVASTCCRPGGCDAELEMHRKTPSSARLHTGCSPVYHTPAVAHNHSKTTNRPKAHTRESGLVYALEVLPVPVGLPGIAAMAAAGHRSVHFDAQPTGGYAVHLRLTPGLLEALLRAQETGQSASIRFGAGPEGGVSVWDLPTVRQRQK